MSPNWAFFLLSFVFYTKHKISLKLILAILSKPFSKYHTGVNCSFVFFAITQLLIKGLLPVSLQSSLSVLTSFICCLHLAPSFFFF